MNSNYVFEPVSISSVPVLGSDNLFPVRRILCVGANYVAHQLEMGRDPSRELPFFFSKPRDSLVLADKKLNTRIPFPKQTNNLHYEIEMVVGIGEKTSNIETAQAENVIWGYGVGIDLTRRDLQKEAKDKGRPWELGKGFDYSAVISYMCTVSQVGHPSNLNIWLKVNNEIKQKSNIDKLIWSVPEMISFLSKTMNLEPGDIIYTGTPEGVGKINKGDIVTGGIDNLAEISITLE